MAVETDIKSEAGAKRARLSEAWAMRDAALAAGMETWDVDRIAAEVRKIREGEES